MFKKNLKQIVSSFGKIISELEELQASNLNAIVKNNDTINKLSDQNTELNTEATQASKIASNVRKLIEA